MKTYHPWGGMTNHGMKAGINTDEKATEYLKYLDGEQDFTPIAGLKMEFDDNDGPNSEGLYYPFRIVQDDDGKLLLKDHQPSNLHYALCQWHLDLSHLNWGWTI